MSKQYVQRGRATLSCYRMAIYYIAFINGYARMGVSWIRTNSFHFNHLISHLCSYIPFSQVAFIKVRSADTNICIEYSHIDSA